MAKVWCEDIQGWNGLKYLTLIAVPMKSSRRGAQIDLREGVIERHVARELIQSRNPIHGRELAVLRKALGLSLERMAAKLEISHSGLLKWERQLDRQLLKVNEVSVRLLCAEELGVSLPAKLSKLRGTETQELSIEVSRAKRRYKPRKSKNTSSPSLPSVRSRK